MVLRLVRRTLLCGLAGMALPAQAQTQPQNPQRRRRLGNELPTPPANADQLPAELFTYQSRGRPIRAAAYRPLGTPRGGVVLLHGSGGIGPEQLGLAQKFAGDGYLALVPTYLDAAEDDRAAGIIRLCMARHLTFYVFDFAFHDSPDFKFAAVSARTETGA